MHFDQHAQLCSSFSFIGSFQSRTIQLLREIGAVHGIHALKQLRSPRRLVALQMPDQVPGSSQIAKRTTLPFPLLNSVLPELPKARIISRSNRASRMSLRHPDQGDLLRAAPSAMRSGGNPFVNAFQSFPDSGWQCHRFDRQKIRPTKIVACRHPATNVQRQAPGFLLATRGRCSPPLPPPATKNENRPAKSHECCILTVQQRAPFDPTLGGPGNTTIQRTTGHMTTRGLLIAIEGIDGSGKQTQAKLLEQSLKAEKSAVFSTGFPQYESWFGRMVGKFLNGDFGPLETVDPRFTALLYAGDRFEAKNRITSALEAGKIVLVDRYIGSNLAHQVARAPVPQRAEFLNWIEHLEYNIYG